MADAKTGEFAAETSQPAPVRGRAGLLRRVVENAPIPTFLTGSDGRMVVVNQSFCAMLGYAPGECIGLDVEDVVHPDDVGVARRQVAHVFDGDIRGYQGERRLRRKDGSFVWALSSASAIPDANGRPEFLSVQVIDIDGQKRAEAALVASESRWNFALESAGQGVWDYDLARHASFFSRMWHVMRGFDPEDESIRPQKAWLNRVHPEDRERVSEHVHHMDSGGLPFSSFEYRERHRDGHYIWILSRGRAVERFPDGRPSRVIGTDTDITSVKRAEERLQFANTLLMTQMETSPDAILVVDASMKIVAFNQRFADMWGLPKSALDAKDDGPVLAAVVSAMRDEEAFIRRVEYLYRHPEADGHDELETKDGRLIDRHTGVLRIPSGEYLGRVWFFRDITERKQAEAQILRSARCDPLTGLANRTVFMESVARAVAHARRNGNSFAVLFLDLDQFKDVNDTLGHPVGDDLIQAVAERLRANVREADIVARFGGDEFAILVTDADEAIDAAMLADKLIATLGKPFTLRGNTVRTGVSIGLAMFAPDQPDAETMMSRADLALYRAKAEGPGLYRFFTAAMESEVRARVALDSELREAIEAGQLFLEYQPQAEIGSGKITGVEALVRWRHPTRGLVPPSQFIPVAERSGLIATLGRWVIGESCRQMRSWMDAGIAPWVVAVNLSAVQFKSAFDIESDIAAALEANRLPASRLELELTETVLMAASGEHNDVLQRLRQNGVRLAIDDFGVGYSSFDYLRRFPVHRIKIAQDFIAQITTAYGSAAIVRATIGLCRELGINVIAEGVETPEQLALLTEWGCREAQGYYLARPMTAEAVAPLLAAGIIVPGEAASRTAA